MWRTIVITRKVGRTSYFHAPAAPRCDGYKTNGYKPTWLSPVHMIIIHDRSNAVKLIPNSFIQLPNDSAYRPMKLCTYIYIPMFPTTMRN